MSTSSADCYSLVPFPNSDNSSPSFAIPIRLPPDTQHDLLSFLGIAQALLTDFLDITWQPTLGSLGRGGTSEILQSDVNENTSFAFKRSLLANPAVSTVDESQTFKVLIAEVLTLGHPLIWQHSNIVNFHGICWEFDARSEKVYPVLVFEKAQLGSLHSFMETEAGKRISLEEKLGICADVAEAILELHRYGGIVHGDIKPANVLVFKDGDGYVAKMSDFGHSVAFNSYEDLLSLGGSRYWVAPEWHRYRQTNLTDAMKMDAFSFGAMCMWLLFYHDQDNANRSFYEDIETERPICAFAQKSVAQMASATDLQKGKLHELFGLTLRDEAERDSSFESFIHRLTPYKDRSLRFPVTIGLKIQYISNDFHLSPMSLRQLYRADFRVRTHIVACLEGKARKSSTAAVELAICYELGFGVVRDTSKSRALLSANMRERVDVEERIESIKNHKARAYQMGANVHLQDKGCLQPIELAHHYDEHHQSEEAKLVYKREIKDTENSLGAEHAIPIILKGALLGLLVESEELKEAEEIATTLVRINSKLHGPGEQDTLISMESLAKILNRTKRCEEAEAMQLVVLDSVRKRHGLMHLHALTSMDTLAAIYRTHHKWKEAEDLFLQIIESKRNLLGPGHQSTLRTMHLLVTVYSYQNRWNEAEQLQKSVVNMASKVCTPEHSISREGFEFLAVILCKLDRWKEAEEPQLRVVNVLKKLFGPDDPRTLQSIDFLVTIHMHLKQWEKADAVAVHIYKSRLRSHGQKDPKTLDIKSRLAAIYTAQKRTKEAVRTYVELLESWPTVFGLEDPKRLAMMARLGWLYLRGQTRIDEAERLAAEALNIQKRILRSDHPEVLFNMHNLARIYRAQGKQKEVEKMDMEIQDALKGSR